MTKTEQLILAQLVDKARGDFVADTMREINAGRKLVVKGLAVETSATRGRADVYCSEFGRFRGTVRRTVGTLEVKFEAKAG